MPITEILDPTGRESIREGSQLAPRLPSLNGARVGLIDNGKPNANLLLDAIARRLSARGAGASTVFVKENVGIPVDAATLDEIRESCDFVVAALGDCGSCSAGTAQDSLVLERHGIPAVSICSKPFAVTAHAMARSYGADGFEFIFTPHPVASLNADELDERAAVIVEDVVRVIVGAE